MPADTGDPTTTIQAFEEGSGSETIVFIHGFGAAHGVWDAIRPSLVRQARTIAYDLPGHGLSLETPGAGSAKFAARAILADLSKREAEKIHAVGHSMGGAIATLMALAEPQRIASLTLLAPGGFGPEINGPLLRRYARAVDALELRACLAAMSGENATITDDALRPYLAMRGRPGQTEKLVEIAAAITKDNRQGMIPREMLATLAMPVTVLWGTDAPVLPFEQAHDLPANFTVRPAPGAGHMLVGEAPGLLSDAILANLAQPG
jgi:pyruvate dehydrogenase E2 component (dihydrolipoamide acetyltransferase)